MRWLLQNAATLITKCVSYYKMRWLLQNAAEQGLSSKKFNVQASVENNRLPEIQRIEEADFFALEIEQKL